MVPRPRSPHGSLVLFGGALRFSWWKTSRHRMETPPCRPPAMMTGSPSVDAVAARIVRTVGTCGPGPSGRLSIARVAQNQMNPTGTTRAASPSCSSAPAPAPTPPLVFAMSRTALNRGRPDERWNEHGHLLLVPAILCTTTSRQRRSPFLLQPFAPELGCRDRGRQVPAGGLPALRPPRPLHRRARLGHLPDLRVPDRPS